MFKDSTVAVMYAVTPCHAGSGSALGVVDLPIQRERHTNWPIIQSSGVKGAFRANFDFYKDKIKDKGQIKDFEKIANSIFGSESTSDGFAGSLSISDARILAFPMRSNVSPFVWITCPAVLKQFARNLCVAGKQEYVDFKIVDVAEDKAYILSENFPNNAEVLLEDCEVKIEKDFGGKETAKKLVGEYFKAAERLLLVSDEVFDYGVSNCTQIMAQIKIDQKTGTTSDGSLRYQEELPCDTIMYTILNWGDSHDKNINNLQAETIKKFVKDEVIKTHIQIGGDITTGRGIFKIDWK